MPNFFMFENFEMPDFSYLILKMGKIGHFKRTIWTRNPKIKIIFPDQAQMKIHGFLSHVIPFFRKHFTKKVSGKTNYFWMFLGSNRPVSIWPSVKWWVHHLMFYRFWKFFIRPFLAVKCPKKFLAHKYHFGNTQHIFGSKGLDWKHYLSLETDLYRKHITKNYKNTKSRTSILRQ